MVDVLPIPTRRPATNDAPPRERPLRVLHVLGSLNRGGVETWLMNVLRHIDPHRVRFDFVTHTDKPGAYDEEARALGARVYRCTGYRRPLRYARQLRDVIAGGGPYDAVHSHVHDYSGAVLWAAARAGVPVRVAHSHNDTSGLRARASLVRRAYQWLMRRLIRRYATRHPACSRVAGEALFGPAWATDPRAVNLPYGIDLGRFADPPDRATLAAGLGLPPGAKVIGHVGRFDPQKNHRRLVEMAAVVLKEDPAARLVLVGDGPLRPEIERHAEALGVRGQVVFAGLRGDVPAVMGGVFDVFLFPSLFEGLGLVVVEAQAAGVPVVMSDAVPAEAVRMPGRVTSLPLDAPDGAWAARLRHLLARRDDPGPPFEQRLAALRDFDVHQNIARLEQIYRAEAPGRPSQQGQNESDRPAIVYPDAKRLWSARRRGVSFKDTATLARHSLFLHPGEVRWFQDAYAAAHPGPSRPLASYKFGDWADEFLHTFLGVESLTTIDHSAYEGAGVVHDLNAPVPAELVGRFDVVLDAGTLEHVFNFPVAISNAMRMLKVGGTLFMTTPANNLCGHGFNQFSPELMFRVFTPSNGFALRQVTLSRAKYAGVELSSIRETYQVTDPASLRRRVMLMSKHPVLMMVEAVKEADVPLFKAPPQQSDYVLRWEGGRPPPAARGLARRVYERLPQALRHHVQGVMQARRFSFANRSAYARIN